MSAVIVLSFGLRAYFVYENKRRDSIQAVQGESFDKRQKPETDSKRQSAVAGADPDEDLYLSDRQNLNFRYSY